MTTERSYITYSVADLLSSPATQENWSTEKYPNAKELAEQRLLEIRAAFLEKEKDRFHVAKVIKTGATELWNDADINTDPEEGDYRVLDHTTGLYDSFANLTEVKANLALKKQKFIESVGLNNVKEIVTIEPISTGLQQA